MSSMRLADKWVCDSGESHHITANKQYFATHKRLSALVNISVTDKGTILARRSGRVNIAMLVEGKWCPGYLEEMWNVPDIGRHRFSVQSAVDQGISVVKKHRRVKFQRDGQLMAIGRWMTDTYAMDIRVVIPRLPAKLTLQRFQKPFSFGINGLAIKTNVMCERCWKRWKST
jgi:hypothetical protein